MIDSYGRSITYARVSVTDLCNLRCAYCMPDGIDKKRHDEILTIEQLTFVCSCLSCLGVSKIRLTGGEPLVRRGLDRLLGNLAQDVNVKTVSITTNGQLLTNYLPVLNGCGVKNINVSLDTLDSDKYRLITKCGDLQLTLKAIQEAAKGFRVKINCVLLKGINDNEIEALASFAQSVNCELRFIELMPFAIQRQYADGYFLSAEEVVSRYGLTYLQTVDGKVRRYRFDNGNTVGFISPLSNAFCASCNRIRITADGKLLNCLHQSKEYDLKPYLNDKQALMQYIEECVKLKPPCHNLATGTLQTRPMEKIGG